MTPPPPPLSRVKTGAEERPMPFVSLRDLVAEKPQDHTQVGQCTDAGGGRVVLLALKEASDGKYDR